jgi:hypothetical protein
MYQWVRSPSMRTRWGHLEAGLLDLLYLRGIVGCCDMESCGGVCMIDCFDRGDGLTLGVRAGCECWYLAAV